MKRLLVTMTCLLIAVVSCGDNDAMQKKMEETAERNKQIKEEMEAKKKEKPKFVDETVKEEMPPIVEAATKGDLAAVKTELGKGTLVDTKDSRQRTALYQAVAEGKKEVAKMVGNLIARRAAEKNITLVVFDRGGYKYHGRVKNLGDGAREGGLIF